MTHDADTHRSGASGRSEIPCSQRAEGPATPAPANDIEALAASLQHGSRTEWVQVLQSALGVKSDGVFGPVTQRALSDYKIAASLTAHAPQREHAAPVVVANAAVAAEIVRLAGLLHVGCHGEQVRALQQALEVEQDGVFNVLTQTALADFRLASNLPENLGMLVQQLDPGQRSVFTIATALQDPAAGCYGVHQLAAASGTMAAFVSSPENAAFASAFVGLMPGTAAFNEVYLQVATNDPGGFAQAQHNYMTRMAYVPVLRYASNLGFSASDRGVQEALYSQSVQHGVRDNFIILDQVAVSEAGITAASPQQQIQALYAARGTCIGRQASAEKHAREVSRALRISSYFQRFFKLE